MGLLSTARINAAITAAAADVDEVEVVAVASRDAARAHAHATALGVPRALGSYEALLEDPDVDAVYVSVPNGLHVPWTLRALAAGKHVLCEKPLSRRPAEVERAFDAAERAALVLTEGFMWRHHPQTARLVSLLDVIGTVRMVRAAFSFPLAGPDVRLAASLDGGSLMDVGCYCVGAIRLVCGEPELVTAQQILGGDGVDVRMAATLRFRGGALAHLDCGFDIAARDELEVAGERGVLRLGDPWHAWAPGIEVRGADGSTERLEVETADAYALELRDLAAAIANGREPLVGRADAIGQARTIAALYESAATGRAVAP